MKTAFELVLISMILASVAVFAPAFTPAFACGNGTKCCWTECHAGTGCIQRCDDGR